MLSTRKIIRAFLASPGDLQEERKAIREVVNEFNESWANELGYQIELVGWEETVAGFGRPQHLINQDLDRCDLFLGMIWKRWGTPPDHDGDFSSGFQEEFERSIARREDTGSPEVSLFFKEIPDEFLVDPGDDLKKVLDFRENVIVSKKIFFQNFSVVRDIETLVRKCITAYVNRIRSEDESSNPDILRMKHTLSSSGAAGEEDSRHQSSPLSAEGFEFLEGLVERIRQPDSLDSISASDVARFRLLANLISKPGNEQMNLGVHDINILYRARTGGTELGEKEIRLLARLGFQHYQNENVPLWTWYSALANSQVDAAIFSSIAGANEGEKVGAISVMTALALDLPTNDDFPNRDWIINDWFSEGSSVKVRTTALGYLAKCGTAGDLAIARKEYDRSDHGTSRSALECMVAILLRAGQARAVQELVLQSQFESINTDLLRLVVEGFEGVETPALLIGLEHRNPKVRLRTMEVLKSRHALDIGMVERLSEDSDALVRREAVAGLLELGKPLLEMEVKKILVSQQKQARVWGMGAVGSDRVGEELFVQYQLNAFKSLSQTELEKRVRANLIYDDAAYFALMQRYFRGHADDLRRDVDDRFNAYFEERMRRLEMALGDSSANFDIVKQTRDLEDFLRKKLTRQGLDLLCAAQKPEDLQRIRTNLRDCYAGTSVLDARYLGKHGDWTDIPILVNAKGPRIGWSLLTIDDDQNLEIEVARAITSISKNHSISDLLSIEMPTTILKKTIELCTESRFAQISRDALLNLFNHKSEEVRKAAAVLAVRAFPTKRIKCILRDYTNGEKSCYYNVIHWLDLGASMCRDDARKVSRSVSC